MLFTIGHGAKTAEQLTTALRQHGIELLVDVRSFPGSRRNPDVSKQAMPKWLRDAGIGYRHEPELGGRRKPPDDPLPSDHWWDNEQFANYAAHTRTRDFTRRTGGCCATPTPATSPSCAANRCGGVATGASSLIWPPVTAIRCTTSCPTGHCQNTPCLSGLPETGRTTLDNVFLE
ncbi:hypothetical protein I552_5987 [Mycobacterium xenopi 3993]|nr:hypothetical protein I552_5987 [Mycobacterium xenopi 3993]